MTKHIKGKHIWISVVFCWFFQRQLLRISADTSKSMLEGSFDCIGLHRKGLYAGGQV